MPIEGWRLLVKSTTWGDYVKLHNLPFKCLNLKNYDLKVKKINSNVSFYELQKSAIDWNLFDFKESIDR